MGANISNHGGEKKILIVGLPGCGKTSIMKQLKLDPVASEQQDYQVLKARKASFGKLEFTIFNLDENQQDVWPHLYSNNFALIFVVDATSSEEGLDKASSLLHQMVHHTKLSHSNVLIYANKMDHPNAGAPSFLSEKLRINSIQQHHLFQPCTAMTDGAGIATGLEWLTERMKAKQ